MLRRLRRFGFLTGWALAVFACSGCSGVHLYREADHTAAVKAQTTFAEAKIGEGLVAERARLESLVNSELDAVRRFALARRDGSIIAIVAGMDKASSWDRLDGAVGDRLVALLISDAPRTRGNAPTATTIEAATEAASDLRSRIEAAWLAEEDMALAAHIYRVEFGRARPSTPAPALPCPMDKDPPREPRTLAVAIDEFKDACTRYRTAQAESAQVGQPQGLWQKLNEEIRRYEEARTNTLKRVGDLKAEYTKAKQAYEEATTPADLAKKATALKEKLEAIAKIETKEFPGLSELGVIETLQTQLQSIDNLLDAFSKGAAGHPPAGKSADLQVVATLGGVTASLKDASQIPRIGVLLLESQRLGLDLEGARRALSIEDGRLLLLKRKRTAMAAEIDLLRDARLQLKDAGCAAKALIEDFEAAGPRSKCREKISFALLDYTNSWSEGRMVEEQVDWLLLALRHTAALDSSEVALRQWQNLVEVPIGRLVAYHASGVKPETIISLVNTAVLIWIGARVH